VTAGAAACHFGERNTSRGVAQTVVTVGVAVAPAELALTAAEKNAQDEFGFGEVESRGHFEKTDRNLFDGQDLDVPTYLRKGIKIAL